jgi:hypothetical protein
MHNIYRKIGCDSVKKSRIVLTVSLIFMVILLVSDPAGAIERPFTALLTGGQEVPANDSNAFGVAAMIFDTVDKMLAIQ